MAKRTSLGFLFSMFLGALSNATDTKEDKPVKFTIIAEPNIKHQDVWFGFMTNNKNKVGAINAVFPAYQLEESNVFQGTMDDLPIKGEIIKIALYVGGGTLFMAEYPATNNNLRLREILIKWNPAEKNDFRPSLLNFEIELTLEDGSKKNSGVHPVMLVEGLSYNDTLGGQAMDFFTKALLKDLKEFDFNFAYSKN